MEMTYKEWKEARKDIKRRLSTSGWALLIYYAIMNVAVIGWMFVETILSLMQGVISRRTIYPWLISVFTLVLPIFLRLTNLYLG